MAGKGSLEEKGLRPLSNSFPLLNNIKNGAQKTNLFERGSKGVSKRNNHMQIKPLFIFLYILNLSMILMVIFAEMV